MSPQGSAYKIDHIDIEKALRNLLAGQSDGLKNSTYASAFNFEQDFATPKTINRGQFEFAFRIARITQKNAARQKAKLCWKHRSIGVLRRLALVVMVASILSVHYI